jgi:hypothetical protein
MDISEGLQELIKSQSSEADTDQDQLINTGLNIGINICH